MTTVTEVKYSVEIDAWLKDNGDRYGDLFFNGVENHAVSNASELLESLSGFGGWKNLQTFEWGCCFDWLGVPGVFRFSGMLVDPWGNYFPNLDVPVKSGFSKIAWELGEESGLFYEAPDSLDSSNQEELLLFTIFLSEVAELSPCIAHVEADMISENSYTHEAIFTTCLPSSHPHLQAIWRSWEKYKQNPDNWDAAGL